MENMPHIFNVEYDGVSYVIYVINDYVTYMNCQKPGHIARNCHTTAQSRLGPITFADLAAGRRVTTSHPPATIPVPRTSNTGKQTPTDETTTAFPVLTQPRQKLRSTEGASATTKLQPRPQTATTLISNEEKLPTHTDNSKNQRENCQALEGTNNITPEILVDPTTPIPTTHSSDTKKKKLVKERQPIITQHDQSENSEDEEPSDAETISSNDAGNSQELPKAILPQTLRDKTMLADHGAIDTLCDSQIEKDHNSIPTKTFSNFLKACRRQKEPRTIAKDYTTNITGLVHMLEETLFNTKDYNLRRRMTRIIEDLEQ
jgi:hypothetical protein